MRRNERDQKKAARWQRLKGRLGYLLLFGLAVLLVGAVGWSALWRALRGNEYPPTPTIPSDVEPNFAYVSHVAGRAESLPPGAEEPVALDSGDVVGAGEGALVRVGERSRLRLGFLNGVTLFLDSGSEIELRQIATQGDEVDETVVQLNRGRLLAATSPSSDLALQIRAQTGAVVEASDALIGASYDQIVQRLDVHCLEGNCRVRGREGDQELLTAGEHSQVQGFTAPAAPGPASYEGYLLLGDAGLVPTPTSIPEGATPRILPTSLPSPKVVTLEPTPLRPTFTPRPSPTQRVFPSPTATVTLRPTSSATPHATSTMNILAETATSRPDITMTATATIEVTATVSATAGATTTAPTMTSTIPPVPTELPTPTPEDTP